MGDMTLDVINKELDERFKLGQIVQFGSYNQGKNGEIMPISWYVIDRKGNCAKLLSERAIITKPYNDEEGRVTWDCCSLRYWLNNEFYNDAFNNEEAESIILSDVIAEKHPKYSTNPGDNTKDKVFLLSYQDADNLIINPVAYLTEWAVANDKFFSEYYGVNSYCYWWLRTPGSDSRVTQFMGNHISGKNVAYSDGMGVRPAIWVNLNSKLFGGNFEDRTEEITGIIDRLKKEKQEYELRESIARKHIHEALLLELKNKYRNKDKHKTVDAFEIENNQCYELLREIRRYSNEEFGLTYGDLLKEYGIIRSKTDDINSVNHTELIRILQDKYKNTYEKPKSIDELIVQNPEYSDRILVLKKYSNELLGESIGAFFKKNGILYTSEDSKALKKLKDEEKAASIAKEKEEKKNKVVKRIDINDVGLEKRVQIAFAKLEEYYPEHKVFSLDSINKELRERISNLSKIIGYESADDMMLAYGFEKIAGEEVREIRPTVKYGPGEEPDIIKSKVDSIVKRLEEYYPNKKIEKGIQGLHKKLSSSISGVYQWLGYEDSKAFLKAYGYEYNVSFTEGRPVTVDSEEIIGVLRERSKDNPYLSMTDLREANPDIAGKIKTIANRSKELYGMSLAKYLEELGIIDSQLKKEKKKSLSLGGEEQVDVSIRKKSTLSSKAALMLSTKLTNMGVDEHEIENIKKNLEDYKVSAAVSKQELGISGFNRICETVEVPLGIDYIAKNSFSGNHVLEKVVLAESVIRIENAAFQNCQELKEVIIKNPNCQIANDAFWRSPNVKLFINREQIMNEYIQSIPEELRDKTEDVIKTMDLCFKSAGGRPDGFWAGDDWKFAFSIGGTVYQTDISPIGDDYREIDDILVNVFNFERVYATLHYFTNPQNRYRVIDKRKKIDSDGNILEK